VPRQGVLAILPCSRSPDGFLGLGRISPLQMQMRPLSVLSRVWPMSAYPFEFL
jgi:hypothetical protein